MAAFIVWACDDVWQRRFFQRIWENRNASDLSIAACDSAFALAGLAPELILDETAFNSRRKAAFRFGPAK